MLPKSSLFRYHSLLAIPSETQKWIAGWGRLHHHDSSCVLGQIKENIEGWTP